MCEHCGCRALPSIDELTREHDMVVSLIAVASQARLAGDVPRLAAIARQIAAVLGPHTEVEEEGLFPVLAREFPDHIATLAAEHRQVHAALAEAADATPADLDWPARLADALRLLREHIRKEQDGVFPMALATLTSAEWERMDAVRDRVGAAPKSMARARG